MTRRLFIGSYAHLNEQIKVPEVVVTAGRSVAARYILAINLRRNGDMLAYGETENVLGMGERKAVASNCVH